jgi:hypothetical protein
MSTRPAPSGFDGIDKWILHQLNEQPKVKHTTHTLFQQLERVLQSEPWHKEMVNAIRAATGMSPLAAKAYITEKTVSLGDVQYAVESLIESGGAKGDRNSGANGVYYTDLKLTAKGEAEAIRQKRKREEGAKALAAHTERLAGHQE